jgi:hypothetical protein
MNIKTLNFWISRKHSVYLQQNMLDMKKFLKGFLSVTAPVAMRLNIVKDDSR